MSFLLRRIDISGHPILKSLSIILCDDAINTPVVYTTGVIGANGTGKSYLMGAIATVFSEIHKSKYSDQPGTKRFSYTIEYDCGGDLYRVSNVKTTGGFTVVESKGSHYYPVIATKNGQSIGIEDVMLPKRVIASTMTVTDKFLAKSDDFYRYKGIRNEKSASTTGTRTIIRKTVESLMDCMAEKSAFQEELRILLNNLGLEEHLHVSYGMRYKNIFLREDMDTNMLRSKFDNWKDTFGERDIAPWGYNSFLRLRDDEHAMNAAALFLSKYSKLYNRGRSVVVTYDVMAEPWKFQEDAAALRILSQLDLVSFPSINVIKKGSPFKFEDSSSGETHLLCQFIGIMADIRHESLILIDEPENSSHPDWQMHYVGWLKDIFSKYNDCHFIIATHSPLILANMKASESTIVRLKRGANRILDEGGMEGGCYSWTIDEILQDVMEMKSNRTEEFAKAMSDFEKAREMDDMDKAKDAYKRLVPLIHPGNVLAEILRIQMIGLDSNR